ncbi:glycosyltransferase family 4 protein [Aliiglaciecola sp. CAU 1673]|uniref:glycosyltransferase family 4 protein n=1 Tax=Aliiglaciecola sp. CAU 1673 TaxID=3032595 RepID=UPI0023DA6803|nr:glycosyltransferase family 4 protein [Aliiglaciecola sp. CAU 1673]MDF2177519.1 glycosyltransferase family 4 protein [Aliiglaciecola sp. CAU 1673]
MKVLYLHQHFTTPNGASGTRSYEVASRLVERGHQVTVLCGSFGAGNTGLDGPFKGGIRSGIVNGIKVIELAIPYSNHDSFFKRAKTFISFALRTILVALKDRYDLVYATSTPLTIAVPALALKMWRKTPYVFEVRDLWPELPKAMGVISNPLILKVLDILESLAYRYSSQNVGLSPGMVEGIRRKQPGKVSAMIPNGCDIDAFQSARLIRSQRMEGVIGQKCPLDNWCDRKFNFVFAGTHGIANGLEVLLDVAKEIKDQGLDTIAIHLIGDGMLKASLQKKAIEMEVSDILIFHPPMPKTELVTCLGFMDAGLMLLKNVPAFYYGTSPNKFFDYVAASMPVVCNYPGWISEMITGSSIGATVAPDDPTALANALIELSTVSTDEMTQIAERCNILSQQFDRDKLALKQINLIEGFAT